MQNASMDGEQVDGEASDENYKEMTLYLSAVCSSTPFGLFTFYPALSLPHKVLFGCG